MNELQAASLESLESAFLDLLVPLRSGDGYNRNSLDCLLAALHDFHDVWRGEATVPKLAVVYFVAAIPVLEDAAAHGEEAAKAELFEAINKLSNAIDRVITDGQPSREFLA